MRIYGRANKCNLLICSPLFKYRDVWFSLMCNHLYYYYPSFTICAFPNSFLKDIMSLVLIKGTVYLFTNT